MDNDVEGGTLAYLLRLAGYRILWFGSMNYLEREVQALRPDVALIAAARQRLEIHEYTSRLMRALDRPPLVFATHWDEQSLPYGAPQDARLREVDVFVKEVKAVSPRTRVWSRGTSSSHVLKPKRPERRGTMNPDPDAARAAEPHPPDASYRALRRNLSVPVTFLADRRVRDLAN